MSELKAGDRVWFEAKDGEKYLMAVQSLHGSKLYASLCPVHDTRSLAKGLSESEYSFVGISTLTLAESATESNLAAADLLAERSVKTAQIIADTQNIPISSQQKHLLKQAIVQAFLHEKDFRFRNR